MTIRIGKRKGDMKAVVSMTSELVITAAKIFHVQPEPCHSIKLVVVTKVKRGKSDPHSPSVRKEFIGRSVTAALPRLSTIPGSNCLTTSASAVVATNTRGLP
jgi:hypothetical protein